MTNIFENAKVVSIETVNKVHFNNHFRSSFPNPKVTTSKYELDTTDFNSLVLVDRKVGCLLHEAQQILEIDCGRGEKNRDVFDYGGLPGMKIFECVDQKRIVLTDNNPRYTVIENVKEQAAIESDFCQTPLLGVVEYVIDAE